MLSRLSSVLNPGKFISVMAVKVNKQMDVGGDREWRSNKRRGAFTVGLRVKQSRQGGCRALMCKAFLYILPNI